MTEEVKKLPAWITFISLVLLLIGIYGTARTLINLKFFEKYPTEGILTVPWSMPVYPQREQDCNYPQLYYQADGRTTRAATAEEKANETITLKNCLEGISEARNKAKINDISQSLLFLLLGTGLLAGRKIFFR